MKQTKKGEITAFLSLIFVLLLSFILAMAESASIQTVKNRKRMDVDGAVFSLFGEYQKNLLEEYQVFALDSTYESGEYEESLLLDRMAYYGSAGITQEITDIQLLTDNNGQAFREQVIKYMESRTGITLVQNLAGMASKWEEREIQGEEMSEQLEEMSGQLEEALSESKESRSEDEEALLENGESLSENGESLQDLLPEEAGGKMKVSKGAILSLVLPKEFQLSGKTIRPEEQVSGRTCQTGRGSFPERSSSTGGVEEKLLFGQYIMEKFSNAMEQKGENRNLDYEVEYILCGKDSDAENLRSVVYQLLMFRFASNYAYLMSDTAKQGEAEAMAATASILLVNPELEPVIKQLILILWSFGESIMDLRSLLSGKKIAFTKKAENWQLQLSGLFHLGEAEDTQEGKDDEDGLTYQQYIQILSFIKGDTQLTMRVMDRVEQNLIQEKELSFFRADACVTKIKLQNTADIWNGLSYTFPVYYGYL